MEIIITKMDGQSKTLIVNPQDTVHYLKQLIYEVFGVPPERQKLVFVNGQTTVLNNDSRTIGSYGLQSGSTVSLLVTQPTPVQTNTAPMQVIVTNEKGVSSTYDVAPDETVNNLKRKVESREGVPVSQQRLVFQSQELSGRKLSDYNVTPLSTIYMKLHLRGG